jgi:hypothetical protein
MSLHEVASKGSTWPQVRRKSRVNGFIQVNKRNMGTEGKITVCELHLLVNL